jgi:hypothetical protein
MSQISTFEKNFEKIVAEVARLRGEMIPQAEIYSALITRAAHGENVLDREWAEVEAEIKDLTRKTLRCFEILKYQQTEIAKLNAALADQAAKQIAKAFCFLSPDCGHA